MMSNSSPHSAPRSLAEMEAALLQQLETNPQERRTIVRDLLRFYTATRQAAKRDQWIEEWLRLEPLPENRAACAVALGGAAEQAGDYAAAVTCYERALTLEPKDPLTAYFGRNNLGFSLNQLGRFVEAEARCRAALALDYQRPNAHKNLGLALAGQGRWREAAESYLEGTRVAPQDGRSCELLEHLLAEHLELRPEFAERAEAARRAVASARCWTN